MTNVLARTRWTAPLAVLALALTTHAPAQEPALEVFYTKLEPKEPFKYTWKGKDLSLIHI